MSTWGMIKLITPELLIWLGKLVARTIVVLAVLWLIWVLAPAIAILLDYMYTTAIEVNDFWETFEWGTHK